MFKTVDANKSKSQLMKGSSLTANLKSFQTLLILIGMIIILSILSPSFMQVRNLLNVVRQISLIAIIGMGVTFCIITTGIDLSSGSVLALVGVIAASLDQGHYPLIVSIIVGLAAGACMGFVNGSISALGRIPPFIATLGMMISARGLALLYSNGIPITGLSDAFLVIGGGYFLGIPLPIYIMLFVAVVSHILLKHTKFGKYVYAIGGNQQAAIVSGINVKKYLILVYTYAGTLAGVSGIVLASRLSAGQPTAGVNYELDAIASAVIGGTSLSGGVGTIPGTIIGALIIGVLNNGLILLNVSPYLQLVSKGIIIVAAVLLDARGRKKK